MKILAVAVLGLILEDNHETTIDVSTYTEPVEIEPSEGKDGMKEATVTLSNIPSGFPSNVYLYGVVTSTEKTRGYISLVSMQEINNIGDYEVLFSPVIPWSETTTLVGKANYFSKMTITIDEITEVNGIKYAHFISSYSFYVVLNA